MRPERDEDLVGLDRVQQPAGHRRGEPLRPGVGGGGITLPRPGLDHRQALRRLEPPLAGHLAGALAAVAQVIDQRRLEHHDRLADRPPFLIMPKLSAAAPARQLMSPGWQPRWTSALAKRAPSTCSRQPRRRAWSPRAASSSGVKTVPASVAWGQRQHPGLDLVDVAAMAGKSRVDTGRRQPAVRTGDQQQLSTTAEELRRAAFVDVDMRFVVADDRAIGRHHRRQRQRVGRGAGRHRQDRAVVAEERPEHAVEPGAQIVAVIGPGTGRHGGGDRGQHFVAGGSGIVRQEVHGARLGGRMRDGKRQLSCRANQGRRIAR